MRPDDERHVLADEAASHCLLCRYGESAFVRPCVWIAMALGAHMLIGALSLYQLSDGVDEGNIAATKAQIVHFQFALEAYKNRFNEYPESLDALVHPPEGDPILTSKFIPMDPWGNPYGYGFKNADRYEIVSLGADRRPGGEEEDADIKSSNMGACDCDEMSGLPNLNVGPARDHDLR